jgi:hypothetical protein
MTTIASENQLALPGGRYGIGFHSFTREATTTLYAAGDVIGNNNASSAVLKIGAGMSGAILGATLTYEEDIAITPRLWLFDSEPTNVNDNAGFVLAAADLLKLIGYLDFVDVDRTAIGTGLMQWEATAVTHGVGEMLGLPRPFASADGNLYAYLQTTGGWTPLVVSKKFSLRLWLDMGLA